MYDFGGYYFGYSKKDVVEDIKERGAVAVITDIGDRCDDFAHITQAFEIFGDYLETYLVNIYEHNKFKYQDEYDVALLWKENQKLLMHFMHFFHSGGYILTDMISDYHEQIEALADALYNTKIEWETENEKTC